MKRVTISKGIDVSEAQGMIDWETVKDQIDYAILRVGYGDNNIDSQFVRNISECNRLGIPVGAYWFSYALNAEMAKAEAEYCIAALQPYKVTYPVAFDFEYDSTAYAQANGVNVTASLVQQLARAYLSEIEGAGYFAVYYTNPDYISMYYGDAIDNYGLWLASWLDTVNAEAPPQPCVMWQWGSDTYDGISGRVDSDFCYVDFGNESEGENMTGEEIYNALLEYTQNLSIPGWAQTEFQQAIALGITDGARPMELSPRYQAAIMAKRAYEKAKAE